MNDQQKIFVAEYLKDLNATQAAIRAGYSSDSSGQLGYKLLQNAEIKAAIAAGVMKRQIEIKIDAYWLLKKLVLVAERCMQSAPVLDRNGRPVFVETQNGDIAPVYKFDASGANTALGLIGKHIDVSAFEERSAHKLMGPNGEPLNQEKPLSLEDAAKLVRELKNGGRSE